ncbi:hypothetical protein D5086_010516 [Populus alba]|uniref:Uncharacterized protein n=1 Tax=Populus alba TaxID=43335 RepID=A0ACC4CAU0_POPAL
MELLGSTTQEWLTVGGTLAGQEIFTNFPSSAMNHATWPLILNEWVQRKTEGYGDAGINDLVPVLMELKSDHDTSLMLVGLDTVDFKSSRLLKAAL